MDDRRPEEIAPMSFLGEYPSPTDRNTLSEQIDDLKTVLPSIPQGFEKNTARIKLADLLVGRNDHGDYIEAKKILDDIITSTLPGEREHSLALIGSAELLLQSGDPRDIERAIEFCRDAGENLKTKKEDFFYGKAKALLAELLVKRGGPEDKGRALELYDELVLKEHIDGYFRLRAAVGRAELLLYFFREDFPPLCDNTVDGLQMALEEMRDERSGDYFYQKGLVVLSEVLLWKNRDSFGGNARKLLGEVINSRSAGDDLRARASLDLADVSSPSLARTLIRGVRNMKDIDPYLLKKAKSIEDAM